MANPLVNTPPAMADEGTIPMLAASSVPTWASSPPSRTSPSKQKARNPRAQRKRSRRETLSKGKDVHLTGPLSELTKNLLDVPIKDMETWVHRSVDDRLREAQEKKKISRPMNSFMLYRSAYTDRAKRLFGENNHQIVSKATGKSWNMEPKDIREKYEALARIERDNHAATHPDYKFKPQKGELLRARGELTPPSSTVSGPIGDLDNLTDWEDSDYPQTSFTSSHLRSQSFDVDYASSTRGSTPFDPHDSFMSQNSYITSSWTSSYPPQVVPIVQPSALHGSIIEDVHFRRGSPLPHNLQYSSSSGLAGLPGATHHELLQPQPTYPLPCPIIDGGHMDPQLLNYDHDYSGLPVPRGAAKPTSSSPYPVWDEPASHCYLTASAPTSTSPAPYFGHMGSTYLTRNPSWDPSPHDPSSELEPWLETH